KGGKVATAKGSLNAGLDGEDSAALIELIGLDRFVTVDKRPARLAVAVKGALDGELAVDGQLAAGTLSIASNGTIRLGDRASRAAELNLKISNANIRLP